MTTAGAGTGVEILVRQLDPGLPLPAYAHPGDAGADLCTAVDVDLAPGERATVPTGIALALPDGFAAFVQPRSGLAARHGVTVLNSPGTVDAGYRGEVLATLVNLDPTAAVRLRRGDRIAQLVIQRVERASFTPVEVLPTSARGSGGHGSTGGSGHGSTGGSTGGSGGGPIAAVTRTPPAEPGASTRPPGLTEIEGD